MELHETLDKIVSAVDNLKFSFDSMRDQEVDENIINFYRERFQLFVGDSCPAAITAYMQKANQDDSLTDLTKTYIMLAATRALDGKDFQEED